jgi:hypothetical protein
VAEHQIRLRAAWRLRIVDAAAEAESRVDLPTVWPPGFVRPFRLSRSFRRPQINNPSETLVLRLGEVPGLRTVVLNGRAQSWSSSDWGAVELPLDDSLPARNELVLEVDPRYWPPGGSLAQPWGSIALVIRSP